MRKATQRCSSIHEATHLLQRLLQVEPHGFVLFLLEHEPYIPHGVGTIMAQAADGQRGTVADIGIEVVEFTDQGGQLRRPDISQREGRLIAGRLRPFSPRFLQP